MSYIKFSGKVLFYLNGHFDKKNTWFWSTGNSHLTPEVPLRAVKFENSRLASTHSTNLYVMTELYPPTVP